MFARLRFDPAHARGHAALGDELEEPDLPRVAAVGAAAQLLAEGVDLDDADFLPVLVAEEGQRALLHRLGDAHDLRLHRRVGPDPLVDDGLHFLQLAGPHRGEMREVEAEPIGRHQGAVLFDVRSQHLAEHGMQEVRGSMVARRAKPQARVHMRPQPIPLADPPAHHDALVQEQLRRRPGRLSHLDDPVRTGQHPLITHLPAAFRVERRAVQHDFDLVAFHRFLDARVLLHDCLDKALGVQLGIAHELHRRHDPAEFGVDVLGLGRDEAGGLACALPLLVERGLEARFIQRQPVVLRRIGRQVERETVGVIQLEQRLACDHPLLRLLRLGDDLIEQTKPLVQRVQKPLLLGLGDPIDRGAGPLQLRIGPFHQVDDGRRLSSVSRNRSSSALVTRSIVVRARSSSG